MIKTEMPSKHVMNPMRVELLKIIRDSRWDATVMGIRNKSGYKFENFERAVERFAEFGLIRYTGGGEFVITDKGKEYLKNNPE